MYIHLGQGETISKSSIIGIFDLDNCSRSKATRNFLSEAEKSGRLFQIGSDIPRSFTVVENKGEKAVYLSQISSATLARRNEADIF